MNKFILAHDKFATNERNNSRLDEALAVLTEGLDMKEIRNVQLNDAKDNLSRVYSDERSKAGDMMVTEPWSGNGGDDELRRAQVDANWTLLSFEYRHLQGAAKKIKAIQQGPYADHPSIAAAIKIYEELTERWAPIAQMIEEVKPFIVKGRKLGERKTPERTLENTGTCACCEGNFKLDADTMVHHGFQLAYNSRNGSCPGVGYKPYEMSPEGAAAYRDQLIKRKATSEGELEVLKSDRLKSLSRIKRENGRNVAVPVLRGEEGFEALRKAAIYNVETDIRHYERGIERYGKKVDNWKPAHLPGDIAKAREDGVKLPETPAWALQTAEEPGSDVEADADADAAPSFGR